MTIIRRADLSDIAWLLEQLRAFDRFYGTRASLFPSRDEDAIAFLSQLITQHPFFVALGPSDTQVGFIAGALAPHPYNQHLKVLTELFWWVDPEYRGTSAGARLLDTFIGFGRAYADWVVMTLEAKSPVADRTLLKRGFVEHERSFLLEVSEVEAPA